MAQAAIAWVLAQGDDVVALLGARRRDQLRESLAGADLGLTPDDLRDLERAVPRGSAAGTRYDHRQMDFLDSARRSD